MDQFFTFTDEAFLKKERDKARKLRSSQWWKRKRASGICQYCHNAFLPKDLTMDHIIPLSRGGKSEKFNLVPCCKDCNTKKRQLLPFEWKEYMDSLKK
ncbi:HNH endonuclease [Desulfobacula phenolica]|uniref:HNH endonuclease n=1 Tax=Desulfobacula phenolica TaxID=90732 RepID=UPI000B8458FA|nr:HNH endonuclease signature motif containing protein [Desulfobacula phenolica]